MSRNPLFRKTLAALSAACLLGATALAHAQSSKIRIAVVTPLTGPLSVVNGPGQNAARMLAEAINKGSLPAPYNTGKGLGGKEVELIFLDENGGNAKQVAEFRALVERQGADVVMGFGSAATCLAIAPVAEELKVLTVMSTCATPRIFEEAKYEYVFRTTGSTTMDSVALALYAQARMPAAKTVGHINPNYALGQDAWRDFSAALKAVKPGTDVVAEQWPTPGAGQYAAEISALASKRPDILHTSMAGADLEAFFTQMSPRRLHEQSKIYAPLLELSMYRMGAQVPDGVVFTARGTNGLFAPASPLNDWFSSNYRKSYKDEPVYTAYQYTNTLLALKAAYDGAAKSGGTATADLIKALKGRSIETPSGTIRMALGNGHQAIQDMAVGEVYFDPAKKSVAVRNVMRFPAECVNPPDSTKSEAWLKGGMAGRKCDGVVAVK
ncbi:MAG TPA: ABC transporter substrate-binding protein [Ramlibacter sp.]|nr:ABC transporter substrate-binding protein [Ramlibacter sp.]